MSTNEHERGRGGWQPIETAHHNEFGDNLLGSDIHGDVFEMEYDESAAKQYGGSGWVRAGCDSENARFIVKPTHWMPLPAAPDAEAGVERRKGERRNGWKDEYYWNFPAFPMDKRLTQRRKDWTGEQRKFSQGGNDE